MTFMTIVYGRLSGMRYYVRCKLNSKDKQRLADSLCSGSLARNKIFYEGMQTALREGTIDENGILHFIEVCYCLEGGLYPMAMEIPVLKEFFEDVVEVKDARLRDQCTMECEFCDCTRNIRLPGRSVADELQIDDKHSSNEFVDIGRLRLNRKKQKEGIEGLRNIINSNIEDNNLVPIFAGSAVSGLFAIFYDRSNQDYFRIKNIPDTVEAYRLLNTLGLTANDSVSSMKMTAQSSLAHSDSRSNIV
jgi:hypothetical protein